MVHPGEIFTDHLSGRERPVAFGLVSPEITKRARRPFDSIQRGRLRGLGQAGSQSVYADSLSPTCDNQILSLSDVADSRVGVAFRSFQAHGLPGVTLLPQSCSSV
jgi:hypothetical protein